MSDNDKYGGNAEDVPGSAFDADRVDTTRTPIPESGPESRRGCTIMQGCSPWQGRAYTSDWKASVTSEHFWAAPGVSGTWWLPLCVFEQRWRQAVL
eukprot:TRINITY_DN1880_c1_g1_i1.p2 TRINITY_DN1880_c1_g1~~TRINITY_DN1880_c1_g1_i1.p2  ORF type:complete len:109 (-),score=10.54 TRINITY_DN1880_c1_g1_i1:59-346(-)